MGIENIVAVDGDEKRLAFAKEMGADNSVNFKNYNGVEDLAKAVDAGMIAGAGLDVFATEPLPADHCFLNMAHPERMSLAPHVAWASEEARERLLGMIAENIRCEMLS